MFLYCVGFRLFRDVCTDIAGGFLAVGCYISVTIKIQFPHKADTITIHIRNILKSLISKDTQFFLFEWDSLFFWGGSTDLSYRTFVYWLLVFWGSTYHAYRTDLWLLVFFWLHVSRVSHGFLASCFLGSRGSLVLLSRVEKWEGVEREFGQGRQGMSGIFFVL